ncbi:N-acetylneuraminate synthase family protein, partial [candidate division KSB1 bacterium]|nr:N-acetylneuraminate synthase family protein [candidate division KSB1 bacterium]
EELVRLAKAGGASAVKFQCYKAKTLASINSPAYWDLKQEKTTNQYDLFIKYDKFEKKDYQRLAGCCSDNGIDFLCTPFDEDAVDFLAPLVKFFKIASADLTYTSFLKKIASKGKPVLLSTGASTIHEIETAIETLEEGGCKEVALMHCILNYPTQNKNAHLGMIQGLRKAFPDRVIGYSDHTLPDEDMTVLTTAYLLGALVIEKHFTYDKTLTGNDHYHAMDVNDLKRFVERIKLIKTVVGSETTKNPIFTEEIAIKNARRSIVLIENLKAGDLITRKNITCKRPGTGIQPSLIEQVVGKKVARDLEYDHILQWSDLQL